MAISQQRKTDERNFQFVTKALKAMETKMAYFAIAICINENKELMVLNDRGISDKDVHELLIEAARAIRGKSGGLIILQ